MATTGGSNAISGTALDYTSRAPGDMIGVMPYRAALTIRYRRQRTRHAPGHRAGYPARVGFERHPRTWERHRVQPAANGWRARNVYGPNFGEATGPGRSAGAIGAAAAGHPMIGLGIVGGGSKIGQMVGSRLNDQLSDLLLSPQGLLPYLDARAGGAAARNQMLGQALARRLQYVPALVAPQLTVPSQPWASQRFSAICSICASVLRPDGPLRLARRAFAWRCQDSASRWKDAFWY